MYCLAVATIVSPMEVLGVLPPPLPPSAYRLEAENLSFQLDIRHIAIYLVNVIDAAPVNIFIREIIEQVMQ